jgi:ribosomal protein S18 acetylase RimI-like enzyme
MTILKKCSGEYNMPESEVRPYAHTDRGTVHRIAADTAFFGDPVETFLDDRRVFCDAFSAYYTDQEPEHAWVACVEGEVVGFLLGCVNTARQQAWFSKKLPKLLGRAVRGIYRVRKRTLQYTAQITRAAMRREFTHVDLTAYPAHLHINLEACSRGLGLGSRLIEIYLEQLRQLGVPGVHLETTSQNEAACHLYHKAGFELLDARPTWLWKRYVSVPVENRCYGLKLGSG